MLGAVFPGLSQKTTSPRKALGSADWLESVLHPYCIPGTSSVPISGNDTRMFPSMSHSRTVVKGGRENSGGHGTMLYTGACDCWSFSIQPGEALIVGLWRGDGLEWGLWALAWPHTHPQGKQSR